MTKVVFKIERDGLIVYWGNKSEVWALAPAVVNQEVKNREQYGQMVQDHLAAEKFGKGKAIIILSSEVLYSQVFSNPSRGAMEESMNKVPIEPNLVTKKVFASGKQAAIVVVNRDLYEILAEMLSGLGWEVAAVAAESVLGTVDESNWNIAFRKEKYLKSADFRWDVSGRGGGHALTWILGVILLLAMGLLAFVLKERIWGK